MEKKILVPLDGTDVGEAVFSKLESIVLKGIPNADVEITLLKVIPIVNFNTLTTDKRAQLPYTAEDTEEQNKNANSYLGKTAEKLRQRGFRVTTMVRIGSAAEEIVKAAHETNASLIAMSTKARSGIIRWAVGSVTDEVIRLEGKIPVLAMHAGPPATETSVLPVGSLQSLLKHG